MQDNTEKLNTILPLVKKPGRYIGGEFGAVRAKDRVADFSFCLVFPDLYEIGMSHQGLQILYHIINSTPGLLAERCYAPDRDMEKLLRQHNMPLFSIESRTSLAAFDALGITLPYELCYTNILTILDLAGIPLYAADRNDDHPLIIGGGSCALNPEPVAEFFDAIVLGDGEEIILEIADILRSAKKEGLARKEKLQRLASLDGVYVPVFFEPLYENNQLRKIEPLLKGYTSVKRRVLAELPNIDLLVDPIVPMVKPIHDRLGVEIARGCTRGCRFCQAGIIYRPVRERSMQDIMQLAQKGIADSGFDELALLSLSSGDFTCLPELMRSLMDYFADRYVSVSMPSMRVGTLTPEIMEQIKRVRKTGFTLAPEAGSDRLRRVINKGITEEDLLDTSRNAFALGWNLLKFYFMIGLPTETMEDVDAIVDLSKKARQQAGKGRAQINVSVGTFVPKPHTPFEREKQLSLAESKEKIDHLKRTLPRKGFKLKWHNPEMSFLEGVFSRGDRRLSSVIETAWRQGARLDGWSEEFDLPQWRRAAEKNGIVLEEYLRGREADEILPWQHLQSGVDTSFLEKERERGYEEIYTADCRTDGCHKCGMCDFKQIKPRLNTCEQENTPRPSLARKNAHQDGQENRYKYRITYQRKGDIRFLGHLEILQLIFRVLRRAELPLLFSHGFNPSPKVSFSPALPVGMESEAEYFDMELSRPFDDMQETLVQINQQMPEGLVATEISWAPAKHNIEEQTSYRILLQHSLSDLQKEKIETFLAASEWIISRIRKGREKEIDLREMVCALEGKENTIKLVLLSRPGQPSTNPREIMQHVLGLGPEESLLARIRKTAVCESPTTC